MAVTIPAVIFVANRNLNVSGRTVTLISSISLRNGLTIMGPYLKVYGLQYFFIEYVMLFIINCIQGMVT